MQIGSRKLREWPVRALVKGCHLRDKPLVVRLDSFRPSFKKWKNDICDLLSDITSALSISQEWSTVYVKFRVILPLHQDHNAAVIE